MRIVLIVVSLLISNFVFALDPDPKTFVPGIYTGIDRETQKECWLDIKEQMGAYRMGYVVEISYIDKVFASFMWGRMVIPGGWEDRTVLDINALVYPATFGTSKDGMRIEFKEEKKFFYRSKEGKYYYCDQLELIEKYSRSQKTTNKSFASVE